MSTESEVAHWLSMVSNQVNYETKFYGPEKVVVTIPTLHFEAFDLYLSRAQIKPWYILDLLASARLFIKNPVQKGKNPRVSFADTHLLTKDNSLFAVALKVDMNKFLYNPYFPKFPLMATAEVSHVGRSSLRQSFSVKHPGTSKPYFTGEIDEVLISNTNRRPAPFPNWWLEKFSKFIKGKERLVKPPIVPGAISNKYDTKVEFEHLDYNSHTGTIAYLKFAMNAAFESVSQKRRGRITREHMRAGLKSMQMFFHKESSFGDTLNVTTYDNGSRGNEILVEICKRSSDKEESDEMCCSVVLEFFEPKNL